MGLLDLPIEIIELIAKQLAEKRDLKHLCEVSQCLYKITVPILYQKITINVQDEHNLWDFDTWPFLRTCDSPDNLLHHAKDIEIVSLFHTHTMRRCVHNSFRGFDVNDDDNNDEHPTFSHLAANLMPLLEGCRDNSLRSFSWALGTCIPRELMGDLGYFPLKQQLVESISIITDGFCKYNIDHQSPIDLSAFAKLKKLSWSGLRSDNDMKTLRNTLKKVSPQLVELELDFICWYDPEANLSIFDEKSGGFFVRETLKPPPESSTHMFPALQVLSLSNISFISFEEEMVQAVDFSLLSCIKLRSCPGWEGFLQCGSRLRRPTRLKSLEILSSITDEKYADDSISQFLKSFHGLEQLAICTSSHSKTLDIWRAALHHKSTLKAFIHHQREIELDEEVPAFEEEHDKPDLSLHNFNKETAEWMTNSSQHPLSGFDLEFLGLCCKPRLLLRRVLPPLAGKLSLRVLHIRQSGFDLPYYQSWGLRRFYSSFNNDIDSDTESNTGSYIKSNTESNIEPNTELDMEPNIMWDMESNDESDTPRAKIFDEMEGWDMDSPLATRNRLRDLAQWAFGPSGFPSLEVIVFGDFSYKGRYARNTVFLCRESGLRQAPDQNTPSPTFRRLSRHDAQWRRELIDKYSDMLEACPTSPLFSDD